TNGGGSHDLYSRGATNTHASGVRGRVDKAHASRPPRAGQMFACHGTDGYRRALFGRFDPAIAAQGRCSGSGVHLADLIGLAYGIPPQFVSGGPDWVYFNNPSLSTGSNVTFQIEAAADPSTTTTDQLRLMLQTMLADRFKLKLKLRRETRELPGYALLVAKNGPRLKNANFRTSTNPDSVKSSTAMSSRRHADSD
ncbi:MAG: TIGR03435 family protein, partial [Acidobacteria bacterium]|nr:TIGR03435 family protein [Acidobacteriota bacterium]